MTIAAVLILIIAAALRTRLGRLRLALALLRLANSLGDAGGRVLDQVQREVGR